MPTQKYKLIPEFTEEEIARFWSKIDKRGPDECHPWIGRKDKDGYGIFQIKRNGKKCNYRAARIIQKLLRYDADQLIVLHSCDNPPCVNGDHLSPDTTAENNKQCRDRGRNAFGEKHGTKTHPESIVRGDRHHARQNPEKYFGTLNPTAKLSEEQVAEIRSVYRPRTKAYWGNAAHLGKIYGVSAIVIRRIGQESTYLNVDARSSLEGDILEWAQCPNLFSDNQPKGELASAAKLTWEQVKEIRRRYIPSTRGHKNGSIALAKEFGISVAHLVNIAKGVFWKE